MAFATERVELPLELAREAHVVPLGARGVIVTTRAAGEERSLTVSAYDRDLERLWENRYRLPRALEALDETADAETAWLLLGRGRDHEVLGARLASGDVWTVPVPDLRRAEVDEMVADGTGGLWFRGRLGRRPLLVWMDPTGSTTRVEVPAGTVVTDLSTQGDGKVQAALRDRRARPGAPLLVLDLEAGGIVGRTEVAPRGPVSLTTGRTVQIDGRALAVGTWEPVGMGSGAAGLWVSQLEDGRQASFESFPFEAFDHALGYLSERRAERVRRRLARPGRRGRLRWQMLVHDPVAVAGGWIQVVEAYTPEVQSQTRTVSVPDGRGGFMTRTETIQVFVGWRFTHAMIVGFDSSGSPSWNHAVRLDQVGPRIEEHVRVRQAGRTTTLLYPYRDAIRRTRIASGEVLDDEPVASRDQAPNVKRTLYADAAWWFDDVFLFYGVDRLYSNEGSGRVVFFLTTL